MVEKGQSFFGEVIFGHDGTSSIAGGVFQNCTYVVELNKKGKPWKFFRMQSEKLISNYTPNPRSKENDLENDFNYGNNVISASAEVRKGFLRKVYGILTVQLLMTCGVSGTIEIIIFDSKYLQ